METSVLEALLEELVDIPLHENEEHDERQDIFDVQAQPFGNMRPLPVSASAMKLSHPQPRL